LYEPDLPPFNLNNHRLGPFKHHAPSVKTKRKPYPIICKCSQTLEQEVTFGDEQGRGRPEEVQCWESNQRRLASGSQARITPLEG